MAVRYDCFVTLHVLGITAGYPPLPSPLCVPLFPPGDRLGDLSSKTHPVVTVMFIVILIFTQAIVLQ